MIQEQVAEILNKPIRCFPTYEDAKRIIEKERKEQVTQIHSLYMEKIFNDTMQAKKSGWDDAKLFYLTAFKEMVEGMAQVSAEDTLFLKARQVLLDYEHNFRVDPRHPENTDYYTRELLNKVSQELLKGIENLK